MLILTSALMLGDGSRVGLVMLMLAGIIALFMLVWLWQKRSFHRQLQGLATLEARYQVLFEHIGTAAFLVDADGCVLDANTQARASMAADVNPGDSFLALLHPEDRPRMRKVMTTRSAESGVLAVRFIGEPRPHQMELRPILVSEVPQFIVTLTEAEEKSRAGQRRWHRGDRVEAGDVDAYTYLAELSHEIRTALTVVMGFAALLGERLDGEEAELCHRIEEGSERLLQTLRVYIDMVRLEVDTFAFVPELFDAVEDVRRVAEVMRGSAIQKGLSLHLYQPPRAAEVYLDRAVFERVLTTLLHNAIAYTRRGRIDVTLDESGPLLTLSVADTGIGIAPERLPHLFEPFAGRRADTPSPVQGAGLGLALSRRLVEGQGGDLRVESIPGKGSIFTINWPRRIKKTATPPDPQAASGAARKG